MRVMAVWAFVLTACATAAGCLLEVDRSHGAGGAGSGGAASSGATSSGATSSGATSSGATGGSSGGCASGYTCVTGTRLFLTNAACPEGSKDISLTACDQCACEAMGSGTCLLDGKISACGTGSSAGFPTPNGNQCFNIGNESGANINTVLNSGSCKVTAPSVAANVRKACELSSSGDCDGGGACVRADLAATACVRLGGVNSCPAGLPYWSHVSDAPAATCACACDPCGDIAVTVYQQKDCQGSEVKIGADGQCKLSGLTAIHSVRTPPSAPLSCLPRGAPAPSSDRLCCPGPPSP